jgi:diguanylate cyclase (GGDEF)-like protein
MAIHTFTDTGENKTSAAAKAQDLLDFNLPELQQTLKLAGLLQTSLEIKSILGFFLDTVSETVPYTGVLYEFEPLSVHLKFGKADRHSCAYRLRIAGDTLGELKFMRNKRFTDEEMEGLENLIYHLVYPLRNAILYQKALESAHLDSLTGVKNRCALDQFLFREVELAHRHRNPLSLLIFDIDHFKEVNDSLGHSAGDAVLKALTACVGDCLRSSDMLFRYGGEEFVVLLSETDREGAKMVAERIRTAVENYPFVYHNQELALTVSIGVASLAAKDDAMRLFNKADSAMYRAKEKGRNRVCHFTGGQLRKAE